MTPEFPPPYVPLAELDRALSSTGFALLDPVSVTRWLGATPAEWQALQQAWDDLPPDEHLKDGGRYRKRRHSCFVVDGERVQTVPHRAHWQPLEYNALHGGMQRWFQPMLPQTLAMPLWQRLLVRLGEVSSALRGRQPWFTEAHTFRIDTAGGIGRPTPEGAHRDGVDLVAVFLMARQGIKGGESRVFEANGPRGQRFTLLEPGSLLLLDDERVIHETTPIQPEQTGGYGWRDTLVVTCRAGAFPGE